MNNDILQCLMIYNYTMKLLKEWHNLHIWVVLLTTQGELRRTSRLVYERPKQHLVHWTRSGTQQHIQRKPNFVQTKLCIFKNVKGVLLYGCETWKNSKYITTKLQVFVNKSLRKLLRIFWPDQITNNELWKHTKQPRIDSHIRKRKWGWLGHTLRKPKDDITRQAPRVEPPRQTGQRETKEYMVKNGLWRGQRSEKGLGRNQMRHQE